MNEEYILIDKNEYDKLIKLKNKYSKDIHKKDDIKKHNNHIYYFLYLFHISLSTLRAGPFIITLANLALDHEAGV